MARGEQLRLAVSATSPNGADGVNHVPRSKPSGARRLGVAGVAAAQQAALREQLRPGRAVDRTVDSAPTEQARVRSVDDRVDVLLRDVPANGLDHRRNASLTPVTRDREPRLDPDDRPPICLSTADSCRSPPSDHGVGYHRSLVVLAESGRDLVGGGRGRDAAGPCRDAPACERGRRSWCKPRPDARRARLRAAQLAAMTRLRVDDANQLRAPSPL